MVVVTSKAKDVVFAYFEWERMDVVEAKHAIRRVALFFAYANVQHFPSY